MKIDIHKWLYGLLALGLFALFGYAILVPANSGPHGPSFDIRLSRNQYVNYVTALILFKAEYGKYPTFFDDRSQLNISTYPVAEQFIEALSGRTLDGQTSTKYGNRRGIQFYTFSEPELTKPKDLGYWQIADRMGNTNIVVCVDHDGDGIVEVVEDGEIKQIRASVTIYTIPKEGEQAIRLWE